MVQVDGAVYVSSCVARGVGEGPDNAVRTNVDLFFLALVRKSTLVIVISK